MSTPNTRSINLGSSTNLSIIFIICFFIMLGMLVKCRILSKHFMNPHHSASLASKQLENKLLNISLFHTFLTSSKN
jgi:hypothetical protein